MSTLQIAVLVVIAGCAIGCLFGIWRAIEKLAKGIFSIEAGLRKLNTKIESIEAVNKDEAQKPAAQDDDTSLQSLEAAISNFEKLKRIELTKP